MQPYRSRARIDELLKIDRAAHRSAVNLHATTHGSHLYDAPASATGQMLKQQLVEGFWPEDADWRALAAFRTQQIFLRGWRALSDTP